MQPDTSTFTNAATRHQPTPNSTTCAEWPSESAAVFDPQLHSLRASTYESFGDDAPDGAHLLRRCQVKPHGTLSRYVKVETDARAQ